MRFVAFVSSAPLVVAVALGCGGIAVLEGDGTGGSVGASSTSSIDPTLGCDLGLADCNGLPEDGCEVDLTSDAASCGRCGHDCQGGACQTGVCQPVVIAVGQSYAYRIAATETNVYWTGGNGSILRAHHGSEPEVIATGQNAPGDIAVNDTHVYWANVGDGTIVRAPLEGTGAEVVLSGLGQPWSLAVSETMLVWAENSTGNVYLASLESGAAPTLIASTPGIWSVALDSTNVYWTTLFNGEVFTLPLAGGDPEMLSGDVISPSDLALSSGRVFFGTASDAGVYAVPVTGGTTVALTAKGGFGIAADGEHVYFGEYDGRLARVPLEGGDKEVLGIGVGTPTDIVVTSTSVYWAAASADGVILGVAK